MKWERCFGRWGRSCDLRPATCALRPAPCALRPVLCALRPATCALSYGLVSSCSSCFALELRVFAPAKSSAFSASRARVMYWRIRVTVFCSSELRGRLIAFSPFSVASICSEMAGGLDGSSGVESCPRGVLSDG